MAPSGSRLLRVNVASVLAAGVIAFIAVGCRATADVSSTEATTSPEPSSTPVAEGDLRAFPATRLASHLFIPVGGWRSLNGLGELIEILHLTSPASVKISGDQIESLAGGISCLRFRYRDATDENTVQTLCVVSFDGTGACSGQERLSLDLNQFLDAEPEVAGNAGLFESGEGLLYAACKTEEGRYLLQQPGRWLPQLYFNTVDAMGDGPYSLGDDETGPQRAGYVTTFGGEEIRPPWILTVGREIDTLELNLQAEIAFNDEDCSLSPSCSYIPDIVQPGDLLRISYGSSPELNLAALLGAPEVVRDRFFEERIGMSWGEIAGINPDASPIAFARLANLEIMDQLLRYFDSIYGLREKGIVIGFWPIWYAQYGVPDLCFLDEDEQALCQRIEAAIQEDEARRIREWRAAGFRLWSSLFMDYREGGEVISLSEWRPDFRLFEGVMAGIGANSSVQVENIPSTLASIMESFADEVGPDMPVVLYLNGPPITAQTGGAFCEADICPSDFKGAFEQAEAAFDSALRNLSPEQFVGFGVALFEGAHFDIREPHEIFSSFKLNRVGETGYNHPILNIYRAR